MREEDAGVEPEIVGNAVASHGFLKMPRQGRPAVGTKRRLACLIRLHRCARLKRQPAAHPIGRHVHSQPREIHVSTAFILLLTVPLTYSIAHGIGYGFISFVLIDVATNRGRAVHPLMFATAAAFAAYFVLPSSP